MSHLTVFDQNNHKPRFQNAYEYLNNIKLEIKGLKSSIELEVNDIVGIVGIFRIHEYTFNKNWGMLLTS